MISAGFMITEQLSIEFYGHMFWSGTDCGISIENFQKNEPSNNSQPSHCLKFHLEHWQVKGKCKLDYYG